MGVEELADLLLREVEFGFPGQVERGQGCAEVAALSVEQQGVRRGFGSGGLGCRPTEVEILLEQGQVGPAAVFRGEERLDDIRLHGVGDNQLAGLFAAVCFIAGKRVYGPDERCRAVLLGCLVEGFHVLVGEGQFGLAACWERGCRGGEIASFQIEYQFVSVGFAGGTLPPEREVRQGVEVDGKPVFRGCQYGCRFSGCRPVGAGRRRLRLAACRQDCSAKDCECADHFIHVCS